MDISNMQDDAQISAAKPFSRNGETFVVLLLFCFLWLVPWISGAQAGGLGGVVLMYIGPIIMVVGALILFFPLRWLIRQCFDGYHRILSRTVLAVCFLLLLIYAIIGFTPSYIEEMERVADEYYMTHPQEFENPIEGKTIDIRIFSGPYITYFVYTQENPPKRGNGGIIIDYKNGWYFSGAFYPI